MNINFKYGEISPFFFKEYLNILLLLRGKKWLREYIRREVKFVCMVTRCVFRGVIRSACRRTRREFQDAIDSLVDGFSRWEEKKKKERKKGGLFLHVP